MPSDYKFVWINANPSFKQFHRPLLNYLSQTVEIEFWEYHQTLDEASSLDSAIELLREHLRQSDLKIHLIGHGVGGEIALSYARLYPSYIASLTLLSVAVQPGINWQSYYYQYLRYLPCDRDRLLQSIARSLFPHNCSSYIKSVADRLDRDLLESPCNHSLFNLASYPQSGVKMPLLVCGAADDPTIDRAALTGWQDYLKPEDTLFVHPQGSHFFHHFFCTDVGEKIVDFWSRHSQLLLVKAGTSYR
jgi:pimeloyl-ACP methyl ester carboxylesterase